MSPSPIPSRIQPTNHIIFTVRKKKADPKPNRTPPPIAKELLSFDTSFIFSNLKCASKLKHEQWGCYDIYQPKAGLKGFDQEEVVHYIALSNVLDHTTQIVET